MCLKKIAAELSATHKNIEKRSELKIVGINMYKPKPVLFQRCFSLKKNTAFLPRLRLATLVKLHGEAHWQKSHKWVTGGKMMIDMVYTGIYTGI